MNMCIQSTRPYKFLCHDLNVFQPLDHIHALYICKPKWFLLHCGQYWLMLHRVYSNYLQACLTFCLYIQQINKLWPVYQRNPLIYCIALHCICIPWKIIVRQVFRPWIGLVTRWLKKDLGICCFSESVYLICFFVYVLCFFMVQMWKNFQTYLIIHQFVSLH